MRTDYEKISDLAQNKFFMGYLKEKIDNFRILMGEDVDGVDDDIIRKNKIRTHIPKRNQDLKDILTLMLKVHKAMQNQQVLEPIAELNVKREKDKPSKTELVKKLLAENPKMPDWDIAERAECSIDWVKQLRKAKQIRDELTFKTDDLKGDKQESEDDDENG